MIYELERYNIQTKRVEPDIKQRLLMFAQSKSLQNKSDDRQELIDTDNKNTYW